MQVSISQEKIQKNTHKTAHSGQCRDIMRKKFLKYIYYLFIFGCVWSSLLCIARAGATLRCGAQAYCGGFSCCRAWALGTRAQQLWHTGSVVVAHGLQQLWHTGLVAPRHVESSQTRARSRVPCIGRQTLNHCATREAPYEKF